MPPAEAKPTFITLGPIRIRRKNFLGVYEKEDSLEVLTGSEGYGVYTIFVKNPDEIDDFWSDYHDYQSNGYL